jgi:hypothetical protein
MLDHVIIDGDDLHIVLQRHMVSSFGAFSSADRNGPARLA